MPNTKISALSADTAPTADDLVVTVNDPGGTPATKKSTITNFTKAIPVVIGDSGSGGTKGLVPAPGAGDAAANKFLKADGTFAVPAGSGIGGSTGSTDNALLRADGTGGSTAQASPLTVDDNGALTVPEIAAPSTPTTGKVVLYAKTDGLLYSKDDAGTETVVTGGGGGGGTPGGSDTHVQFNDGGAFGGDADLAWNKTSNTLTLGNTGPAQSKIDVGDAVVIGGTGSGRGVTMGRDDQVKWTSSTAASGTVDTKLRRINSGYGLVMQNATDATNLAPTNQRWLYTQGGHRVTADFAKAANTTLGTITGCTVPLLAGSNETLNYYTFIFEAEVDCDATGGYKFAVAYSGSLDEGISYYVEVIDEADGSRDAFSRQTTSGGAVPGAGPTAIHVRIVGNISVGSNGNLTIQFAQSAASGTSTVKNLGSLLIITPVLD